MTTRKYSFKLKHDPEKLLGILKSKADEKGWSLDGSAKTGNFSAGPFGIVSGEYKVSGSSLNVTVQCSMNSLWPRIERELKGFFG